MNSFCKQLHRLQSIVGNHAESWLVAILELQICEEIALGRADLGIGYIAMCGRFTNEFTWAELHALYSLSDELFPMGPPSNMQPGFNIAPTQNVNFVALNSGGTRELLNGRWWLVPFFAKELPKAAMFNARIETVDTSGAFWEPFKRRRCLIPADAYFEWTTSPVDGKKDPWLLHLPAHKKFSFAGLWAHNDNLGVTSCTNITAPAAEHIAHIHGRMPVFL